MHARFGWLEAAGTRRHKTTALDRNRNDELAWALLDRLGRGACVDVVRRGVGGRRGGLRGTANGGLGVRFVLLAERARTERWNRKICFCLIHCKH